MVARPDATPLPPTPPDSGTPEPDRLVSREGRGGTEAAAQHHPSAQAEVVLTRPILIRWPRLEYPLMARRLRREAKVQVRVAVDESGRAVAAKTLLPRACCGFDQAAVTAALQAQYRPGTRNSIPERMEVVIAVRFELRPRQP